jgi:hypothetical protein
MQVLSPFGVAVAPARSLAKRPTGLTGCRLGLLDNSKPNADVLLARLAELLMARAGVAEVRRWRKPGSSRAAEEIEAVVGMADVVLTGSAD